MISKLRCYFWFVVQTRANAQAAHLSGIPNSLLKENSESGSLAGVQVLCCPITLQGKYAVLWQGYTLESERETLKNGAKRILTFMSREALFFIWYDQGQQYRTLTTA